MNIKILLPFQIFAEKSNVLRIVAETDEGSFGILPHRLDCVAALCPGILTYETRAEGVLYVAIDQGVLVKAGQDVPILCVEHCLQQILVSCFTLLSKSF